MEVVKGDPTAEELKRARKEEKRRRKEERRNHAPPSEVKLPILSSQDRDRVVAAADKIIASLPSPVVEEDLSARSVVKKQPVPREVRPLETPEDFRAIVNAQFLKATAEIAALEEFRKALEPYVSDEVFAKRNSKRKVGGASTPTGKKRRLNPFNIFWQENKTEGMGLRELATLWRALPAEKKAVFVEKAKRLSDAAAVPSLD